MPSFTQPTPEDGKVLAFSRDVRQAHIPTTAEVNPEWFQVDAEDIPSLEELTQALDRTSLVTPRIPDQTVTSNSIAVPRSYIAPLKLIHPLILSPFLSPMSTWHLLSARASMIHLYQQVQPFLKWIQGRTKSPTNRVNALTSVDLKDATLHA